MYFAFRAFMVLKNDVCEVGIQHVQKSRVPEMEKKLAGLVRKTIFKKVLCQLHELLKINFFLVFVLNT